MENTENKSIKERLRQFIMFKNISTREFERLIQVSYGFVANMSNSTSPQKIAKISHCFPELSIEWLLTGDGNMLKNDSDGDTINQTVGGDNNGTMIGKHTGKYSGKFAGFAGGDDISRLIATNKELLAQNRKSQEQIDRLIGIIEKMQKQIES